MYYRISLASIVFMLTNYKLSIVLNSVNSSELSIPSTGPSIVLFFKIDRKAFNVSTRHITIKKLITIVMTPKNKNICS